MSSGTQSIPASKPHYTYTTSQKIKPMYFATVTNCFGGTTKIEPGAGEVYSYMFMGFLFAFVFAIKGIVKNNATQWIPLFILLIITVGIWIYSKGTRRDLQKMASDETI